MVRAPGVIVHQGLSFTSHIKQIFRTIFPHLQKIAKIKAHSAPKATEKNTLCLFYLSLCDRFFPKLLLLLSTYLRVTIAVATQVCVSVSFMYGCFLHLSVYQHMEPYRYTSMCPSHSQVVTLSLLVVSSGACIPNRLHEWDGTSIHVLATGFTEPTNASVSRKYQETNPDMRTPGPDHKH